MSKSLCAAYTQTALSTGTTYTLAAGNGTPSDNATEALRQAPVRQAGRFSYLQVNADNVGTSRTVRLRKNTAAGNLLVSPTNTTAGLYIDSTNTDDVVAGDLVDFEAIKTGTALYSSYAMMFEATVAHTALFNAVYSLASAAGVTVPIALSGITAVSAPTEANAQHRIRCAPCKITNIYIAISTNTRADATTFRSRVNGANGNNTLSIGAAATGLFEDTAHTDTLADGDLVNLQTVTGAGAGTLTPAIAGCAIIATGGQYTNDVMAQTNAQTRAAGAGQTFYGLAGRVVAGAAESNTKIRHGFRGQSTNLRIRVTANTYTGSCTVNLRKNGADATQTFNIGAAGTGTFEDTTHTDHFLPLDDINIAISGGTANTLTFQWFATTETDLSPYETGWTRLASAWAALALGSVVGVMTPFSTTAPIVAPARELPLYRTGATLPPSTVVKVWSPSYVPEIFRPLAWDASAKSTLPRASLQKSVDPLYLPEIFRPLAWPVKAETSIRRETKQGTIGPLYVPQVFYPQSWDAKAGSTLAPKTVQKSADPLYVPEVFRPLAWPVMWGSVKTLRSDQTRVGPLYVPEVFRPFAWNTSVSTALRSRTALNRFGPDRDPTVVVTFTPMAWDVRSGSALSLRSVFALLDARLPVADVEPSTCPPELSTTVRGSALLSTSLRSGTSLASGVVRSASMRTGVVAGSGRLSGTLSGAAKLSTRLRGCD